MGPVGKLLKITVMEGIMVHGTSDDLILHMLNAQCLTMSLDLKRWKLLEDDMYCLCHEKSTAEHITK